MRALADAAVVLVGHGRTNETAQLVGLRRHAETLIREEGFADVHVAMLHGPGPRPAEVLGRVTRRPVFVVPVMMCDGVATGRAVAAALGTGNDGSDVRLCPPVGMHPRLTVLIVDRATVAARELRVRPADAALLLIAHGSQGNPASAEAARRQVAALRGTRIFAEVAVAFLEQPPPPPAVLQRLNRPVVAVGLFAAAGHHAINDVTTAIATAGRPDIAYVGPIGADPRMPSVIASMIVDTPALTADTVR